MKKFLKKFVSMILSLVMLIAITTLGALFVVRSLLAGSSIIDLALESEDLSYSEVISDVLGNDLYSELEDYIDEKEFRKSLDDYFSEAIKYSVGVKGVDIPSTDEMKDVLYDSFAKYEKDTGRKLDKEAIDIALDVLDDEIENNFTITDDSEEKAIFNVIYSDKLVILIVVIIVVCIIVKFLLFRNILSLFKSIVIVAIFNACGNYGFGVALKSIMAEESDNVVDLVVDNLLSSFNNIAIISLIIAVVFIILSIIVKVIMSKKKVNVEEETNGNSSYVEENYQFKEMPEEYLNNENEEK